jgi:DNA-directed RNA polymerase specialized sigma24 family protein
MHTDLERALALLPEEFRTPLLLAEVEGLALEEVARVMDCPVGTVKSRIFRAKERLRARLKDYESQGGR